MYTDFLDTLTEQNKKFFEPTIRFNQLIAQNIEQFTNVQLDAVKNLSQTSIAQIKAASEVKDAKSAIDFNISQFSALTQLSQQMIKDGQKLMQVGREFKDNLEILAKEQQTA